MITKNLRGVRRVYNVTYVFADSVLCLGSVSDQPVGAWKIKIKCCLENRFLKDLNRIDGERVEFEWTNFPGFTTLRILEEIQKMMAESKCEPKQLKGRIIFMSMYNDMVWRGRGNRENCIANSVKIRENARKFPQGRWSFLGLGCEKKWYGTHTHKPDGEWDSIACHQCFGKTVVLILLHCYICQSAQCLRSNRRFAQRISQRLSKCKKTRRKRELGVNGCRPSFPMLTLSLRLTCPYRETSCEKKRAEIRRTS